MLEVILLNHHRKRCRRGCRHSHHHRHRSPEAILPLLYATELVPSIPVASFRLFTAEEKNNLTLALTELHFFPHDSGRLRPERSHAPKQTQIFFTRPEHLPAASSSSSSEINATQNSSAKAVACFAFFHPTTATHTLCTHRKPIAPPRTCTRERSIVSIVVFLLEKNSKLFSFPTN